MHFHENFHYFCSIYIFHFISPRISLQNRIDKYFSLPIFIVTFTKNIFILSNSDSVIHFKLRSFRICLNFFSQNRIISINRFFTNRMMISIIVLYYCIIQITKTRFAVISSQFFLNFSL